MDQHYNLNQTTAPENRVISYHKLRTAVGLIGMLLPFALWIGNTFINETNLLNNSFFIYYNGYYYPEDNLKDSISHFYYSTVGELFTGSLCAVALFLFCYRGYPKPKYGKYSFIPGDSFMANFAATMALLVVIFPTSSDYISDNLRNFISSTFSGYVHYGAAVLFFSSLSIISFVNFRRTKTPEQFGTMKSHPIYKSCAIIMMVCMFVLFIVFLMGKKGVDVTWADNLNLTFWLETVMLIAFGFSWVVKGKIDQQVMHKNIFGNGVEG